MKSFVLKMCILGLIASTYSCTSSYFSSSGGYDDVYDNAPAYANTREYTYDSDEFVYENDAEEARPYIDESNAYVDEQNGDTYVTNNYYDDEEYNYYGRGSGSSYQSRISRFHQPNNFSYFNRYNTGFNSFSNFNNPWNDPFFNSNRGFGNGVNVSINFGMGYVDPYAWHVNRFHRNNFWNNGFNDPFGYYGNPFNSGFGNVYNFYGNGFCPSPYAGFNRFNNGFNNGFNPGFYNGFYDNIYGNFRSNAVFAPRNSMSTNSYNEINSGSQIQASPKSGSSSTTPQLNSEQMRSLKENDAVNSTNQQRPTYNATRPTNKEKETIQLRPENSPERPNKPVYQTRPNYDKSTTPRVTPNTKDRSGRKSNTTPKSQSRPSAPTTRPTYTSPSRNYNNKSNSSQTRPSYSAPSKSNYKTTSPSRPNTTIKSQPSVRPK